MTQYEPAAITLDVDIPETDPFVQRLPFSSRPLTNIAVAPWVTEMLDAGNETFYRSHEPLLSYYDPARKTYIAEALFDAAPREREE